MNIRNFVSLLIFVLISAILLGDGREIGTNDFVYVTFDDLATRGKLYDGKNVIILGYYIIKSPDSILYPGKPDENKYHGKMLWVGGGRDGDNDNVVRKNHSWSLIMGKYNNESVGIFGKYFGSIDKIFLMYPVDK